MKTIVLEVIGDSSLAGAPRHLLSILENIDNSKFEMHAICPPGPLAGEIRKHCRHTELEIVSMRSRFDTKAIRRLRESYRQIKPDIIHIHGTRGGVLGRLAAIGINKPVIYTEHLWTSDYRLSNFFMNFLHYSANWFLDLFTTLNIAVSGAVKDFMVSRHITYEEKIKVIYNGILPAKHEAKIFRTDQEFLLATVATLNEHKGIQYLIRALNKVVKEYPGVQLEIIGDGEYKRTLVNLVKKLKLKNYVKFVGFVPNIEKYLSRFDLYIQPSLSESFGLAILQAMSVGLPVVATATGGIPEVVTQDKSGLLVAPANPEALSQAILDLLRDPERARKMGAMARRDAKLRFNLKDMIIALETTYEELAKTTPFTE
jgi:glycosyltransferase involved in cell wall biosynthesis